MEFNGNVTEEDGTVTRRRWWWALWPAAAAAQPKPPDASYRVRAEALDAILSRGRDARRQRRTTLDAYRFLVDVLAAEEDLLMAEVRRHSFEDITEREHWFRGRLKFPTAIRSELRLLAEGRDPATDR